MKLTSARRFVAAVAAVVDSVTTIDARRAKSVAAAEEHVAAARIARTV